MKEKPKVTLNEIVGLEDVKEALKEAVVYPSKRPDLFPLGWPREYCYTDLRDAGKP